jgi:hypothetical protein
MSFTISRHGRRGTVVAATALALGAAAASAAPASADRPDKYPVELSGPVVQDGICDFPIRIDGTQTGFAITYSDGVTTRGHLTEQDVFTAEGASGPTLTSRPYTYNVVFTQDADGNYTSFISSGVMVDVPLPQGGTFHAAGRFDFIAGGVQFAVRPDSGGIHNLDAFCAALAG